SRTAGGGQAYLARGQGGGVGRGGGRRGAPLQPPSPRRPPPSRGGVGGEGGASPPPPPPVRGGGVGGGGSPVSGGASACAGEERTGCAERRGLAQLFGQWCGGQRHAGVGGDDLAVGGELRHDAVGLVHRDGEADARRRARRAVDGGVDADEAAGAVEEGPAAV